MVLAHELNTPTVGDHSPILYFLEAHIFHAHFIVHSSRAVSLSNLISFTFLTTEEHSTALHHVLMVHVGMIYFWFHRQEQPGQKSAYLFPSAL